MRLTGGPVLWHVLPTLCCSDGDVWSEAMTVFINNLRLSAYQASPSLSHTIQQSSPVGNSQHQKICINSSDNKYHGSCLYDVLWCIECLLGQLECLLISLMLVPLVPIVWWSLLTSREAFSVNIKYLNMNDHSIIALYPASIFNIKWSFSKIFLPIYNWHNATAISYFQNSKHSNHRVLKLDHLL